MNRKSKKPEPSLTTRIVQQVRHYQLTTSSVVALTLTSGHRLKAKDRLHRLVTDAPLHRQELSDATGKTTSVYFTLRPQPLIPMVARACFAVLWYCRAEKPNRSLLSAAQIARLVEGMCHTKGYKSLSEIHVAVEPSQGQATPRIEMIRVSRREAPTGIDSSAVHIRLADFVEHDSFSPWWHFARADRFVLTYLAPGTANLKALRAYFDRHPISSSIGGGRVSIPIRFAEARQLSNSPS